MKPAPERLQLATYPYATDLDTRFGDMDVQRHLNNVALAGLCEEARVRFVSSLYQLHSRPDGERPVLAEATIRYLAEGRYPGRLVAAVGVGRVGRSSYVIAQAMFQDGVCIGVADIVIVWTRDRRPHPIPDEFRAALTRSMVVGAATPALEGAES